jgi:tRNA1(Val) A37 N6-methylase TrmN6
MSSLNGEYSQLTIDITNSLDKVEKQQYGIFITPKVIIEKTFDSILEYTIENNIKISNVLEPACGTCEIVKYCNEKLNNITIDAIEFNNKIFQAIETLPLSQNIQLINQDFIQFNTTKKYDLIVTNPPYFVCDKEYFIQPEYTAYIQGRANIFGLFILHSLSLITPGGMLAFIVPKSFLNSIYYSKIRNYIKKTCRIIELIDFEKDNKFIDTQQATFGLILQRLKKDNKVLFDCDYSIEINDNFMFSSDTLILKNIFEGSTTLQKLGLQVKTGTVVWNQHKDELTDDPNESVLIYNTNLTKNHTIELRDFVSITNKRRENSKSKKTKECKPEEKRQYIMMEGKTEPVLVVNRGNGNSKYKLNYALVDFGPYLVENHLNVISSIEPMKKKDLIVLYNKVMNSFKNEKTQIFINMFLGNNGLSKTELETIFPIYL